MSFLKIASRQLPHCVQSPSVRTVLCASLTISWSSRLNQRHPRLPSSALLPLSLYCIGTAPPLARLCLEASRRPPRRKNKAELVQLYSALLYRVALSLVHNPAEAEDVVQDVSLRVL